MSSVTILFALHVTFVSTALIGSFPAVFISDVLPASLDLSGTDSALYPYDPEQGNFREFWFPPVTSLYPYFLFPPNTRNSHSHTDTQLPLEETLNTPLEYDEPDVKLTGSYSGSISVANSSTSFESQLETPLVGNTGNSAIRQQLQNNGNGSLFDEDGEPRRTIFTHSSTYSHVSECLLIPS